MWMLVPGQLISCIHNSSDVNVARVGESITDVTDKGEYVETKENEPVDKVSWIVRKISELDGYYYYIWTASAPKFKKITAIFL